MMSFRAERLPHFAMPVAAAWLLAEIAEAKGRHDLYVKQSPQVLKVLRETALVQSVESSNRIEGVTVSPERLRPLVLGTAKARDRSEQEIQGYRRVLAQIHSDSAAIAVAPDSLSRFHATILEGSGDAGEWKRVDNQIIELRSGGESVVRFQPVSAARSPQAVAELCQLYQHLMEARGVPALVTIAALVLDFLCIHPFRDGNGRVSRLLTLLGLYHHGYEVGRYISIERVIEDSREDYYRSLHQSSQGWHEGAHDLRPWLNYFLVVLHRAYNELEERAGQVKSPRGAKTWLVRAAIDGFRGRFTLADLTRACPGVSQDMVRRVLRDLQRQGVVTCLGRGPGAHWQKEGNTSKRGQ